MRTTEQRRSEKKNNDKFKDLDFVLIRIRLDIIRIKLSIN